MSTTTTQPDAVRECSEALAIYLSAIRTSRSVSETNRASIVFSAHVSRLLPDIIAQAEANRLLIEVGKAAVGVQDSDYVLIPDPTADQIQHHWREEQRFTAAISAFRAARERGTGK